MSGVLLFSVSEVLGGHGIQMSMDNQNSVLSSRDRSLAIWAALIALFLGALDSLVMSAAMPSIVADLGGLPLYAWVYSAYFLARAVSLPIFGKLTDLYNNKSIFLFSIILFILASIAAGLARSMTFLIISRIFQGIGAGGVFALVYIVLSKVAPPGERARTLSLGSSIWGISSVIGPTLGGFIVSYFSWRWIFFINIPIGMMSLIGIAVFLHLPQENTNRTAAIDFVGLFLFSISILGILMIFTAGGREIAWVSPSMLTLVGTTCACSILFYYTEKKALDPMIDFRFFAKRNFTLGNGATFLASFTIFSLFAYAPIYIQGSLGLLPMQVGLAMVSLSLGWSFGSLYYGRKSKQGSERSWAITGGVLLLAGSLLTIRLGLNTAMPECFLIFFIVGTGMGFVSLATLILVQNSATSADLGVVTSFHQFSRSLGGTVGVAICGGFLTTWLFRSLDKASTLLSEELLLSLQQNIENILLPGFQQSIPLAAAKTLKAAVLSGVFSVFIIISISSLLCLLCCISLNKPDSPEDRNT